MRRLQVILLVVRIFFLPRDCRISLMAQTSEESEQRH
jgi:hypothetical protein